MNKHTDSGQCLCGGVRFTVSAAAAEAGLCHCKMCRRWGGGLPLSVIQGQVAIEKGDTLTWWKSSGWGERGFCSVCGSSLFWRTQDAAEQSWAVSVGTLDDDNALKITEHIFYDDKGLFYETADDAPRLSGAEFTAKVLKDMAAQYGDEFLQQALAQCRALNGDAFADAVEGYIKQ